MGTFLVPEIDILFNFSIRHSANFSLGFLYSLCNIKFNLFACGQESSDVVPNSSLLEYKYDGMLVFSSDSSGVAVWCVSLQAFLIQCLCVSPLS